MSIDKSTMKIFFEAMEGTMLGSGYSSKIVTTPMGPFKWNSATELWENVNNGMVMNNISFQDMILMDYDTNGGGYDMMQIPDFTPVLSGNFGNMNGVTTPKSTRFASASGPQIQLSNANAVTVLQINRPITIQLVSTVEIGSTNIGIRWSRNSTSISTTYITPFSVNSGDILRIGGSFPNTTLLGLSASGFISVINTSDGNKTLATIPWSYSFDPGDPNL
jgi:hypothetical protein